MAIKIEFETDKKLPSKLERLIQRQLSILPKEHLRGIDRLRIVDTIIDPRARNLKQTGIPALYHPRQAGGQLAWLEISASTLFPVNIPWHQKLVSRLSFKTNLAALVFSLVGQHYYLTLRHSTKRTQLEPLIRTYAQQQMKRWSEQENKVRTKLFKPLEPTFERLARTLRKRTPKTDR
jgi:hypothetical protein